LFLAPWFDPQGVEPGEKHQPMTDTELKTILKRNLFQLEGVVEGLAPFHPRLGQFMRQRLDEMQRALYIGADSADLSMLSDAPKPDSPEAVNYQKLEPFKHDPWKEEEQMEAGRWKRYNGRPVLSEQERLERKRTYAREYMRRRAARLKQEKLQASNL
jgi:hypothetical protein